MEAFETVRQKTDVCVIGGGMAGVCASIAAARRGCDVTLVHDRPVLGGNASEEIRMWICGAFGANLRETGIIEEIELENIYKNPNKNYSRWSAVLFDFLYREPRVTMALNASVLDAASVQHGTEGQRRISAVKAWQLTTQRYIEVEARLFIDCSGDSILAPLVGAEHRWGRESADEFGESHAEPVADGQTMGMSCLIEPRETDRPQGYKAPTFAHRYERKDIGPNRPLEPKTSNFWWLEAGGDQNTIADTERVRDDLLGIATGVWDYLKRNPEHGFENWDLEWLGFLPGKRESRRYVGDHIITQNDVEAGGPFEDVVAYAGWTMDNHPPRGFYEPGSPTVHHPAPSPWGIPYRSLYSRNIENLLFAGRNISATHIALSSSRVMRTCAIIGQAAGTAAAMAVAHETTPRGVYEEHLWELQQALLWDDSYLPGVARESPTPTAGATLSATNRGSKYKVRLTRTEYPENIKVFSSGIKAGQWVKIACYEAEATADPEVLRNGIDRTVADTDNGYWCRPGDAIEYTFPATTLETLRIVFDSNLSRYYRDHRMKCWYALDDRPTPVAESLVREYDVEVLCGGAWARHHSDKENYQRLVLVRLPSEPIEGVRLVPKKTWGEELIHIYAMDIA